MSRNFSQAPNYLGNSPKETYSTGRPTAPEYPDNRRSTAGPSSPPSQNHPFTSTTGSRIDAMQQTHFSWLLDGDGVGLDYPLLPPQTNASAGLVMGFAPKSYGDQNGENPAPFTSPQAHKSGFDISNNPTWDDGFPDFRDDFDLLEQCNYQYTTLPRYNKVPAPTQLSNNGSGRGRLGNSPTRSNSRKYMNDSDGGSNDSKVTKAKKIHRCTEQNCGKAFGRSAELKRHNNSVHRNRIAGEKRPKLLNCPHEGCGRIDENGFIRKDNLVQHLRGVHGDNIEKKTGRGPTTAGMSPASDASNAGASSPVTVTGNGRVFEAQQQEPFVYTAQPLRGVHEDIFEKIGRGPATVGMSLGFNVSSAGAGSPMLATGNDQLFHCQQQGYPDYMDLGLRIPGEDSGSPSSLGEYWENLSLYPQE